MHPPPRPRRVLHSQTYLRALREARLLRHLFVLRQRLHALRVAQIQAHLRKLAFGFVRAFLARNLRLQRLRIQIEQPFILRLLGQRLFVLSLIHILPRAAVSAASCVIFPL